jgi:hypothetical protein
VAPVLPAERAPGPPGRRLRWAAAALAYLVLAAAVVELPRAVRAAGDRADLGAGMTRTERDLAPARAVDLEPALVLRADELAGEEERYHVAVSGDFAAAHGATLEAIEPFAAYWLLPRRAVPAPADADWILSYGVAPEDVGANVAVVEEPVEGQWLLRVRR